jgi:hypothetical protein
MTAQSILRIDFNEINQLRITCAECGADVVIPVQRKISKVLDCPGRGKRLWDDGNQGDILRAVYRIQESLQVWNGLPYQAFHLGFDLPKEGA